MRKVFLHISAVCAAVLFCLACSGDKATVIPRGKLARIYAEMLMIDQWALTDAKLRRIADTCLVYEPIFQKYGYDTDDYIASVNHYMHDPERFSRILRTTSEILDEQMEDVKERKKAFLKEVEIGSFVTDFDIGEFYPYLSDEPYVHYYDSLAVEPDSCSVYRIVPIETADTLYDRLRMIVNVKKADADSLAVDAPSAEEVPAESEPAKETGLVKEDFKEFTKDVQKDGFPELKSSDVVPMTPMKLDGKKKLIRHGKLDSLKLK